MSESGYSRNFQTVRISDAGDTIEVFAHSIDEATGRGGAKDPARKIFVAVIKTPGAGEAFVSQPVNHPGSGWPATIHKTAEPGWPSTYDEVFVIGVADEGGPLPRIWHDKLPVQPLAAPQPPPSDE
ncbi:MAG: hypothetical protein QOJ35_3237 [Solirubrobacteraceae bacterium]|nr:hypothetical protein [Solirubrobacteraceae bacterium]